MMSNIFPPTETYRYALLSGITFSNKIGLSDHSFIPFFKLGEEKAFHRKAEKSSSLNYLIIEIGTTVKNENLWKTLSTILEFSLSNYCWFEYKDECDYHWIKNFDPKLETRELEFLYDSDLCEHHMYSSRFSGTVKATSFIKKHAPFIELLYRDELFYVMWMNLYSAFKNHDFCMICAYEKEGYEMHPNHEIPIWQRAQAIPAMEIGIVQSARAVETILGKPGKREIKSKFERVLTRWRKAVDIDPYDKFYVGKSSYINYYYKMFNIRGTAAHSLGSLPYELRRNLTIEAQSFAFEIMRSYLRKNKLNESEASSKLNLNDKLCQI